MAGFIAAAIAVSTAASVYSQKKAAKKARNQAKEDAIKAREAEVFGETTGKGQGELGTVDLTAPETGIKKTIRKKIGLKR